MLKIKILKTGAEKEVELSGVVDEYTNLNALGGAGMTRLAVHCREVQRINSVGIKYWRQFFKDMSASGVKVTFHSVSPALVAQINYIPEFLPLEDIESVCASFFCQDCSDETVVVYPITKLRTMDLTHLAVNCAHCGKPAPLDDLPQQYFAFLNPMRSAKK